WQHRLQGAHVCHVHTVGDSRSGPRDVGSTHYRRLQAPREKENGMAKVIIIGGHGKVARLLAPLLRERGDEVTSVIRNPDHTDAVAATGAHPVVADVEQLGTEELTELLRGQDAVVWSAGPGGGNPPRTYAVDRDAAIRTIDAAAAAGVERFVMVSYLGARPDHGVPADSTFFPYAEAKAAADTHLRASSLAWTIVAPGGLTLENPSG